MASFPALLAFVMLAGALSGCMADNQDHKAERQPEPGAPPKDCDAPVSTGCGDILASNPEPGPTPALPPPIHDERDIAVAAGGADGPTGVCSEFRPCFDYPFTLARQALLRSTATAEGAEANSLALEVLTNGQRVEFESVPIRTLTVTMETLLEPGEYLLRVHVVRMVAGRIVLDGTFLEPPAPREPLGPDTFFDQQWGLPMSRVPQAWPHATGKDVTIAIIDSGIDLGHPDLRDKLVLVPGAAFVGGDLQDTDGHGTHVAGIAAAARDNGIGIAGVAPDALIMPVRVFTGTVGTDPTFYLTVGDETHRDDIAAAIRLATDSGADVISMSLAAHLVGGETLPLLGPQVQAALDHAWSKGLVLVAASGNGYVGPQCADIASHPNVLCVGSVGRTGQRSANSNLVVRQSFVVAPGGEFHAGIDVATGCSDGVLSTMPPGLGTCRQEDGTTGDAWYAGKAGTSLSAPFAAGVAALLVEQGLTNAQVLERIKATADPRIGSEDSLPDPNPLYGLGLVDAYCAVTAGAGEGCDHGT